MSEDIPHVWTPATVVFDYSRAVNDEVYSALKYYFEEGWCAASPYPNGSAAAGPSDQVHVLWSILDGHIKGTPLIEMLREMREEYEQEADPILIRLRDEINALLDIPRAQV